MGMKRVVWPAAGASRVLAALLLGCLGVAALAVACGGEDEEKGSPTATGPPGAAASPTAAVIGTPTPTGTTVSSAKVPGISDTEIVLGAGAILTGSTGAVYSMIPQATEAYFKYINDSQGGVCGRKITYKLADNQDDPAKGLEAIRKLVEQDKVFALVGSLSDNAHLSAWDYISDKGVPDIASVGLSQFSSDPEGHSWTVALLPSYRAEGEIFGRYISGNLPDKKVGALYLDAQMGEDSLQGLEDGLDPQKNELVSAQAIDLKAISIRSEVTNIFNAGAEVLVIFTGPGFASQAIKEAQRQGWAPDLVLTYISSDELMFQYVSPELLKGAVTLFPLKLAAHRDDPAVARHYELMRKYGGPSPTNFSIYGQVVAELAVDILGRSCDKLTREGVMDAVLSTRDWHSDLMLEGVTITFSETDRTGTEVFRMLRATVENGKGKFEWFGPLYELR